MHSKQRDHFEFNFSEIKMNGNKRVIDNYINDESYMAVRPSEAVHNGSNNNLLAFTHGGPRIPGKKDALVLAIVTGGTIAMKNKNGVYVPESNYINQVIEASPTLNDKDSLPLSKDVCSELGPTFTLPNLSKTERRVFYCMYEYEKLLDSSNMTIADYKRIALDIETHYKNFDGFVILHGTDTMAYTASYLSFMLENLGKPIILTGAQVPLCATRSDGVDNLLGALLIAGNYSIPEVGLYFHHRLYRGNRVVKVDSESFHAFDSPNMEAIVNMGVDIKVNWEQVWRSPIPKSFSVNTTMESNVALLRLFPGITASTVRAFLNPPIQGVVLQTYGAGNGPSSREDILEALREASERGVLVVNCTQCTRGTVTPSYETGKVMEDAGIVPGFDMTPEAALAKLSYILAQGSWTNEEKRNALSTNLRGELTKPESASTKGYGFIDALAASLRLSSKEEKLNLQSTIYPPVLCFAAKSNNVHVMNMLSGQGADLCCANYDGRTALHVAASDGKADAVRYLLRKGATVYAQDRFGNTPLENAIQFRKFTCIDLLREAGAHLSRPGVELGVTLCSLASKDDVQGLEAWAKGGADLGTMDYNQENALHVAARGGHRSAIDVIMRNGVDPHIKNGIGLNAFDLGQSSIAEYMRNLQNAVN